MQAIELFEERCVNYQAKGPISDEITALNVYLNSHHIVYSKVDYMMPEKPPTSEMLALAMMFAVVILNTCMYLNKLNSGL